MSQMGGGGSDQQRSHPHQKWFKYIQCQTCELFIYQIIRQTKVLYSRYQSNPNSIENEITEEKLFDLLDNVCNPYTDEGLWITRYDLKLVPLENKKQEKKKKMKLQMSEITLKTLNENFGNDDHFNFEDLQSKEDIIGECERECETVSYTCMQIIDNNNIEIVEYLYSNVGHLKRSALKNLICGNSKHSKSGKYCAKEKSVKRNKKNKNVGKEPWYPLFDSERRQMVAVMDAMPDGVKMYDPSMMNMDQMMDMYESMPNMPDIKEKDDVTALNHKFKKAKQKNLKPSNLDFEMDEKQVNDDVVDTDEENADGIFSGASNWLSNMFGGKTDEQKEAL